MRAKKQTTVSACSVSVTFLLILAGSHWSQMRAVFVNISLLYEVEEKKILRKRAQALSCHMVNL
jgi:hypothetical protein